MTDRIDSLFKVLFIATTMTLAACSSQYQKPLELSEQAYYDKAQKALNDDELYNAVEHLKKLEARYPFGVYAKHAQLELMYAYLKSSELDQAFATAERFIRLNPQHEQVDYAFYMRALASYELSYAFYERHISGQDFQRDPLPLQETFGYFDELINRYPQSIYVTDARARMVHIRELLAQHELYAARYYMKRHAFVAAANRATMVIEGFQKTHAVADALALQIEAYQAMGQEDKAQSSFDLLLDNYPEHKQINRDGQFSSRDLKSVDRPSFKRFFSFKWLTS